MSIAIILFATLISCGQKNQRNNALVEYVPEETEIAVKISNLATLQSDLKNSAFYNQFKLSKSWDYVDNGNNFLKHIQPIGEGVLCLKQNDTSSTFTFITRNHPEIFNTDSIPEATIQASSYKKNNIVEVKIDGELSYKSVVDSLLIISTSEEILQEIVDGSSTKNSAFKKALKLEANEENVMVFPIKCSISSDTIGSSFDQLASLRYKIIPNGVTAAGVLINRDTLPNLTTLFKGLSPQPNQLPNIVPLNAKKAISITFDDHEILANNLRRFHTDSVNLSPVFESISEIGFIETPSGVSYVLHSIDSEITGEELAPYRAEPSSFKETALFSLADNDQLFDIFSEILPKTEVSVTFELDDYFVFSSNETSAKEIVTAYKNNATLVNTQYFENTALDLSVSSSVSVYSLNGNVDNFLAELLGVQAKKANGFPLIVGQITADRGFAHINLVAKEAKAFQESSGVIAELFNFSIDNTILSAPQFFSNHRTNGKDIAVQDVQNVLHLISSSGKVLWKKQLDGPILGQIKEIDILKNGKKQLAFCTPKTLHVLDRNGKNVKPFPLKYQDEITQPLAVFDYDRKRKYRFVVTQGNEVFMYDNKAKIVQGFTFKNTQSDILFPPKHIRMSNKDYIVIAEENGKLNILSRVGKDRVIVNKRFNFSEIPVFSEGNKFVVITEEQSKETISQTGKTTALPLNVSENYYFTIYGSTKVTLDDNLMRINGKLVELPFGLYNKPQVHVSNRNTYVSITELQEKRVYLFDKNGNAIKGFPVYGSSVVDLADANRNGKSNLVVQGGENEIVLYEIR
ncbi:MAG: hypothetical protein HKN48_07070 [Flavobacteriaceae bacterium]|nr:hypothetical protein [Flavobacteriaceae bacterium]